LFYQNILKVIPTFQVAAFPKGAGTP
jgi:hypothetical protein